MKLYLFLGAVFVGMFILVEALPLRSIERQLATWGALCMIPLGLIQYFSVEGARNKRRKAKGPPTCPFCGYDLTGVEHWATCPGCGKVKDSLS